MEFFTIGVYNSSEHDFFQKLIDNQIDAFCDIRQRRGVRGSKYSFVNSIQLQKKLGELKIKYEHVIDLAPPREIRELQKKIDIQEGQLKRERFQLGQIFIIEYKNKVLSKFDFEKFIDFFNKMGANKIVLFCVEEHPEACHRSIVTNILNHRYNFKISHL